MVFPTRPKMTAAEFRDEIITPYWTTLDADIAKATITVVKDKARLPEDYATIGAFLTNNDHVKQALIPLEEEIRRNIGTALPRTYATLDAQGPHIPKKDRATAAPLKSHKLLTNALRKSEAEAGFNHEKIVKGTFFESGTMEGKLHAIAAKSDAKGGLQAVGVDDKVKTLSKPTALPRGTPTVLGDLDPAAFNVLLRHGYQFKDVAAGAYHGEYTHRLQWYAILQAQHSKLLTLHNPALDIFRSLGYDFAKAKGVPSADGFLWMWQALFDTGETPEAAKRLKTPAYAQNGQVYNCPENLNKALMRIEPTDGFDTNSLWCLRVLLATRWKKRFDEADGKALGPKGMAKLNEQVSQGRTTTIVTSHTRTVEVETGKYVSKVEQDTYKNLVTGQMVTKQRKVQVPETKPQTVEFKTVADAPYALAWYLRDDTVS